MRHAVLRWNGRYTRGGGGASYWQGTIHTRARWLPGYHITRDSGLTSRRWSLRLSRRRRRLRDGRRARSGRPAVGALGGVACPDDRLSRSWPGALSLAVSASSTYRPRFVALDFLRAACQTARLASSVLGTLPRTFLHPVWMRSNVWRQRVGIADWAQIVAGRAAWHGPRRHRMGGVSMK